MELDNVSNDKELLIENNEVQSTNFKVQDISINLNCNRSIDEPADILKNENQVPTNITVVKYDQRVETEDFHSNNNW